MDSVANRCRSVLVIGDGDSQPRQVVSNLLETLLSRSGSGIAEGTGHSPLTRKQSLADQRLPTISHRHSVSVQGSDGLPTTFNLSAINYSDSRSTTASGHGGERRFVAPHSDTVIITFSVHNRESFNTAHRLLSRSTKRNVARYAGNKNARAQFFLVGHHTKTNDDAVSTCCVDNDYCDWSPSLWQQRDIHSEEGEQLAVDHTPCDYREVCTDPASCTLHDCPASSSSICDDLIAAASSTEKKMGEKLVSKEKALKRWLKTSFRRRPRCVANEENGQEENETETASIESDNADSVRWWDESSEGTAHQWSSMVDSVDTDFASLSASCGSGYSSPLDTPDHLHVLGSVPTVSGTSMSFMMASM